MSKFCSNCGNEVDEKAVICVKCGVPIDNISKTKENGKSIASLVLGIIGLVFAVLVLLGMEDADISMDLAFQSIGYKISYGIGFILIQASLGITGLCLGASAYKNTKNNKNKAGIILSVITLVICIIQFIIIMSY